MIFIVSIFVFSELRFQRCLQDLTVPEPSILNNCAEYFQVIISHGYMIVYDVKIMSTFKNNLISGSFPEYGNFKFYFRVWLISPKDAESNFRGGSC